MTLSHKASILIAEGEDGPSHALMSALGSEYEFSVVQDGITVMELLKNGKEFDIILLGLSLPRADGFQVLKFMEARSIDIPTVVFADSADEAAESLGEILPLGAATVLSKPVVVTRWQKTIDSLVKQREALLAEQVPVERNSGLHYPFRLVKRFCYICGCENVPVFIPVSDAYTENWSAGPYPTYTSAAGFHPWDMLRSLVSICPYCLFASSDPRDFSTRSKSTFPYTQDAKKILASSISARRRMITEGQKEDNRFDSFLRDKEKVIQSLKLAEKCCNGLILGGKTSAHCQAGVYATLLGSLTYPHGTSHFQGALINFQNQMKAETSPELYVKTKYFTLVLNMLLGQTTKGRDILKELENHYFDKRADQISNEERDWMLRINHIWKNGIDLSQPRELEYLES